MLTTFGIKPEGLEITATVVMAADVGTIVPVAKAIRIVVMQHKFQALHAVPTYTDSRVHHKLTGYDFAHCDFCMSTPRVCSCKTVGVGWTCKHTMQASWHYIDAWSCHAQAASSAILRIRFQRGCKRVITPPSSSPTNFCALPSIQLSSLRALGSRNRFKMVFGWGKTA